ncbi:GyrI-like domain-containing protein [Shinella sp. DD12]|uniref:GyrI-like domain-containing protein n=1 Tax=Shinella sp. DD12 TaxID=1410620 RepID=UPI000437C344|nr:GyrI-like domain-containing protein [Shinella sp. DD12]EYR78157.1 transcriptional regulator [Shinella sp. DD12]
MPEIVEWGPKSYVAVRLPVVIPFGQEIDPAFEESFEAFAQAGVDADGMEFIKFNVVDMPRLEIEVGMTTDAAIPLSSRLVNGVLPAGRYIRMTYTGPHNGLYDVTAMLVGWAKEKGLQWDAETTEIGDVFASRPEVHDNNPSIQPDPAKLITTLLFKLAGL